MSECERCGKLLLEKKFSVSTSGYFFLRESEIDRWTIVSFFEVNKTQQNGWTFAFFIFIIYLTLTLCWFDEDDSGVVGERGDVLPQLRRVFLLLLPSCCPLLLNLINLEGDSCGDGESESWHPLRWKFNIKSQTDGGEGFVGGGRM